MNKNQEPKIDWEIFNISEAPATWALLTETGWHSMLILAAGPDHVIRTPKGHQAQYQAEIDDTIDEYIDGATVPPRPRGFDWFLNLPQGMSLEDVDIVLNRGIQVGASPAPTPEEVLAIFHHEIRRLYAR